MTDYAEEQRNEIEALMSIYPEELQIVQDSPHFVFQLTVSSSESEEPKDPENENDIDDRGARNLGIVMVFTIVSALQEKLTVMVEDAKRLAEEQRIQKEKDDEEAALKKFEGTRVTIESFLAWKAKFDAERKERKRIQGELDLSSKKLSGKELFMTDATLNDSDVNFLQEEEGVEVDESLFEDMEDLDIDDADDDEDPDWEPDKN
ncbi:hypothetical protein C0Q70_10983 [Pomacea canaliculata]|uniref:RWD domain-containing protein n=1 Tax=Pomacea canaliculata TaxID=400727 RepID=A0A2T7P4Q9_POMCA|nr:hypothetical protein C0Q70_10983 [Pomacea canaliculata]